MESTRDIIRDLAITHIEGEGDWCLSVGCDHVGDDEDE